MNFKKTAATVALASVLAVSGSAVGQVATASPEFGNSAQAYSITKIEKWQWDKVYSNGRWYCGVWEYRIHNWWEKYIQGKKDGWYRAYWAWC